MLRTLLGSMAFALALTAAHAGQAWAQEATVVAPAVAEPPATVQPEVNPEVIPPAVERVLPAIVRIHVVTTDAGDGRMRKQQVSGSGVIISPDGYVVTNHHVARKATKIVCRMTNREELDAKLIGTDPLSDIAVLQLDLSQRKNPGEPLPVAQWGNSDLLRVGNVVYAMGSPAGLSQSVTTGIVSNTSMILPTASWAGRFTLDGEEVGQLVRWIGHDAQIFGGNSGGPLVNESGQVIGINELGIGSIGGAIPGNLARAVAEQFIEHGQVQRSWVGLEVQPRLKESPVAKGILVSGVLPDSPAAKAGIVAGDVITSFDGQAVDCATLEELPLFNQLVLATPVGKAVPVEVIHDGEAKKLELTTEVRGSARSNESEFKYWGFTGEDFTRISALEAQRTERSGVRVNGLRPGGPVAEAKPPLVPGDVIVDVAGTPIRDTAQLRTLTDELTQGKTERVPLLVAFERDTRKYLTVVSVGPESAEHNPPQAKKAWLPVAVQALTRELAQALGLGNQGGVRVTQVYPNKSAEMAGVKTGDIIVKLDGEPIEVSRPEDVEVFQNLIRRFRIGKEVKLGLIRDKQPLEVTVALEPSPTPPAELKHYKDADFEFTARNLSLQDKVVRRLAPDATGVMIERVENAGWADLAHLAAGDIVLSVDREPTPNVDALEKVLAAAKQARTARLSFFVKRGIHTLFLEFEPTWELEAVK
ncbi:MAG: PDZ domain-containing protein [Planctomycetaceae bacterium]|nr:PDZ domain-containing protein [Planctomycetaceae bacterium]